MKKYEFYLVMVVTFLLLQAIYPARGWTAAFAKGVVSLGATRSTCCQSAATTSPQAVHFNKVLSNEEWMERAAKHRERISLITGGAATDYDESHPIMNFIFSYYRLRRTVLLHWSPGIGTFLEGAELRSKKRVSTPGILPVTGFVPMEGGGIYSASTMTLRKAHEIRFARDLLLATIGRPPVIHCFGMHEWAMLYAPEGGMGDVSRHQTLPLRVTQEELNTIVEGNGLHCTHFDAFRFFSADARPLNNVQPSWGDQIKLDQPGCVHANMDLFKWALKLFPFIPSETVADALSFALECRVLDMRASPYDLSKFVGHNDAEFDLSPVRVETKGGRRQYQEIQYGLYLKSLPLREKLISHCEDVLADAPQCE